MSSILPPIPDLMSMSSILPPIPDLMSMSPSIMSSSKKLGPRPISIGPPPIGPPPIPMGPILPLMPIGPPGPIPPLMPIGPPGPIPPLMPIGPMGPIPPLIPIGPLGPIGPPLIPPRPRAEVTALSMAGSCLYRQSLFSAFWHLDPNLHCWLNFSATSTLAFLTPSFFSTGFLATTFFSLMAGPVLLLFSAFSSSGSSSPVLLKLSTAFLRTSSLIKSVFAATSLPQSSFQHFLVLFTFTTAQALQARTPQHLSCAPRLHISSQMEQRRHSAIPSTMASRYLYSYWHLMLNFLLKCNFK